MCGGGDCSRTKNATASMKWVLVAALSMLCADVYSERPTCRATCQRNSSSPVCGTDGKTYSSRCVLHKRRCIGYKVRMMHRGRCKVKQPNCYEEMRRALVDTNKRQLLQFAVYVPQCKTDGHYMPEQCMKYTGYCWCVDTSGKEIPGTRVRQKKPNCRTVVARSPAGDSAKPVAKQVSYKGCPREVRGNFNQKVLQLLRQELMDDIGKKTNTDVDSFYGRRMGNLYILHWKFMHLDKNTNYQLEWKEMQEFLKKTKRKIHPKKCSKTFVGFCDQDNDKQLSLFEWYSCFGVQEVKKCIGEYMAKRKAQQHSSSKAYIPKCNSDGSYRPTQCHETIGFNFCWCVDINTGKPIPNTTRKVTSLDCSRLAIKNYARPNIRVNSKKECSNNIWTAFKTQLVNQFRKQLQDAKGYRGSLRTRIRSGKLQDWRNILTDGVVLGWKFNRLDSDKNGALSNNEFFNKVMKNTLGNIRRGRKCGKKLLNDCDIDRSRTLSQAEWRQCLRTRNVKHRRFRIPLH